MQAIIQLTDKPEDQSVDIAVGLDSQDLNLASPAHLITMWIINNFNYIVEKAGNDRSKLIAAVAAEQLERDSASEEQTKTPGYIEDVNGGRLSRDTAQECTLDQVGSETQPGMPPSGASN